MVGHVLPVLFVIAAWFVATGVVIALDRLPARTYRWSLAGATLVAGGGLWLARHVAADTSPHGAYLGFAAAIAVWGWHEMSFLMGLVTGPRTAPLPLGTTGWRRFRLAAATLIWHEIALALTAVALLALTWRQPNQVAAFAFAVLFVMRVSAKLNIFLGVPQPDGRFPSRSARVPEKLLSRRRVQPAVSLLGGDRYPWRDPARRGGGDRRFRGGGGADDAGRARCAGDAGALVPRPTDEGCGTLAMGDGNERWTS